MMSSGFSTEFPNVADPMHDSYLSCFPKLNDDKFLHQDLNFLPCSSSMAVSKGPEIHQMKEFCEPGFASSTSFYTDHVPVMNVG